MKQSITNQGVQKKAYRISEFCFAHGIGRSKAYYEIQAGNLRAFKIGKATLISAEDAHLWLDHYRKTQASILGSQH